MIENPGHRDLVLVVCPRCQQESRIGQRSGVIAKAWVGADDVRPRIVSFASIKGPDAHAPDDPRRAAVRLGQSWCVATDIETEIDKLLVDCRHGARLVATSHIDRALLRSERKSRIEIVESPPPA